MTESAPLARAVASAPAVAPASGAPPWWLTVLGMVLAAAVVFLPTALRAQFLGFDDTFFFGPDSAAFREGGLLAVLDPQRPIANAFLPVAHASLWLDGWLGGGGPLWPHLHALLLHGLVGAVWVRLLLALGADRWVAHLAGLLFVVHPAVAESVAWVAGRKDLLSGLFAALALLLAVRHGDRDRGGRWALAGVAGCGVLAMYAKATAVVLPGLALLLAFARPGGGSRRLVPTLVLLLVTVPTAYHHQTIAAAEGTLAAGDPGQRLQQVPGAFLHYLGTALWPTGLNVLYPEVLTLETFRARLVPGGAVLVAFALAILVASRRPALRLAALGLAGFALALVPFNTAYPASSIAAADRYLYLALPWLALAGSAGLQVGTARLPWLGRGVLVGLVGLGVWAGAGRAGAFADTETLWRVSLASDGRNAVAHFNLAQLLVSRGVVDPAEVDGHLRAAIDAARYPIHELRARLLAAQVQMHLAEYGAAADHARAAIAAAEAVLAAQTSPRGRQQADTDLLTTRLAAYEPLRAAGDEAGAAANHAAVRARFPAHPLVVAFEVGLELRQVAAEVAARAAAGQPASLADADPRGAAADQQLAAALAGVAAFPPPQHGVLRAPLLVAQAAWDQLRGRWLLAIKNYRLAQKADPGNVDAWLGAARLQRERENFDGALDYASRGLAARPDPALRQEQALALVGLGRLDDAVAILEAHLKVRPHDRDAAKVLSNVLIGRAYARLGEPGSTHDEVARIVQRALAYNPAEPRAHLVYGRLAREQRRFADAVRELELAYRVMPDLEEARSLLADSLAQLGYERMFAKDDDAAADAWLRCCEVAPKDFDTQGVRLQLQRIWRQLEARGLARQKAGDLAGAVADFRRCLRIDPEQHWAAWLLAMALHEDPKVDLTELEALCRLAVAWQERHGLDRSQPVWLLATTLQRGGDGAGAKALATAYLKAPDPDAKPQVLQALKGLSGN